jgi:catechol 2,3-dioxygenase-like lactoylglutathione lyase family enzyme
MTDLPTAPVPGAILEAALYAPDLDAAEAFYGGLLGLPRLMRAGDRHVFYRVGATILLIFNPAATAEPPAEDALPVPPHGARGPGHVCFAATDAEITAIRPGWRPPLSRSIRISAGRTGRVHSTSGIRQAILWNSPNRASGRPEPQPSPSLSRMKASATDSPSGAIPWPVPFITWA